MTSRSPATAAGAAALQSAWLDEAGRLFVDTDIGFGLVHTQDMHEAARAVESGLWCPEPLPYAAMPQRFGFVPSPQQALASAQKQ